MRTLSALAFTLALLTGAAAALAATPAEIATQVRNNWANTKAAYLAAAKPYEGQAAYATLISQYTAATDKAGASLDKYLSLKLSSPAPTAAQLTPVMDQLTKDLGALRLLYGKASGPMVNVLGSALTQQSSATQNALANMR